MITAKVQLAHTRDEQLLAWLYAEFAEEDEQLAAMGLADYAKVLREEAGRAGVERVVAFTLGMQERN